MPNWQRLLAAPQRPIAEGSRWAVIAGVGELSALVSLTAPSACQLMLSLGNDRSQMLPVSRTIAFGSTPSRHRASPSPTSVRRAGANAGRVLGNQERASRSARRLPVVERSDHQTAVAPVGVRQPRARRSRRRNPIDPRHPPKPRATHRRLHTQMRASRRPGVGPGFGEPQVPAADTGSRPPRCRKSSVAAVWGWLCEVLHRFSPRSDG